MKKIFQILAMMTMVGSLQGCAGWLVFDGAVTGRQMLHDYKVEQERKAEKAAECQTANQLEK